MYEKFGGKTLDKKRHLDESDSPNHKKGKPSVDDNIIMIIRNWIDQVREVTDLPVDFDTYRAFFLICNVHGIQSNQTLRICRQC
jgi:hypothetical protein